MCDTSRMDRDPEYADDDLSGLKPSEYFIAGRYVVLTPSYYRNRGRCCNSNCRHCPFRTLEMSEKKPEE